MSETKAKRRAKSAGKRIAASAAELPPALDALLTSRQVMAALQMGLSAFKVFKRSGDLPRPDCEIGNRPRWRASTINRYIEERCNEYGQRVQAG